MKPFEQIVREHGPAVLRVCRAVLGPDEAEDAWSETFLAALGAYPDLPDGANVQAWLVTIAKRKAVDQHRSAARNPLPVDIIPERAAANPPDTDGLWGALKTLPVRQREALAYHHLAGLPYAEVARLLGGSEAACRRSAADGIKKLRTLYKEDRNGIL
ncbi:MULTISPECIES: sigma-70 family RNA polymerase sigma factor [unclassified Arthrobacter]|uniref:RNA polymerase sigma factor n=1 Tax=unclassified Arthrobacter TaxID=235627 RepID=UPI0024E03D46|nr:MULTISPECIES: sigma-70 family RNA polymerase sigma factor [unclassified Arthrobacter]MCC9144369.1 sigma-70 family RNA polymerase sigma factor [Arthrobacter sp. zg-Y919]MDK1275595.1 sigma-70 family RNA polymerase sigma factor [Arthrobacter sp. zg.Y919]WIB03036.1 sigma-70 family RNA polymerase sigma factor [Arthrobacter sp. zg-Y919]